MRGWSLSPLLVCAGLPAAAAAAADEVPTPPGPEHREEIIEQILELRERLEILLAALPPELREEVERRWRERQTGAPSQPDAVPSGSVPSEPTTVPEPAKAPQEMPIPAPLPSERTTTTPSPDRPPASTPPTSCGGLLPLDSNQDGVVSAADRYWRYLRLWFDRGDGELEESEIETLYELGIREIEVRLRSFRTADDLTGEISPAPAIRLRLFGEYGASERSGVLVIDSDRLAGGGELQLVDDSRTVLAGYQPLRGGLIFESADGSRWPLACP